MRDLYSLVLPVVSVFFCHLSSLSSPFFLISNLAYQMVDCDLIIFLGMSKAIHTNFVECDPFDDSFPLGVTAQPARFTCDVLRVAVIKSRYVANSLNGATFDYVFDFQTGLHAHERLERPGREVDEEQPEEQPQEAIGQDEERLAAEELALMRDIEEEQAQNRARPDDEPPPFFQDVNEMLVEGLLEARLALLPRGAREARREEFRQLARDQLEREEEAYHQQRRQERVEAAQQRLNQLRADRRERARQEAAQNVEEALDDVNEQEEREMDIDVRGPL